MLFAYIDEVLCGPDRCSSNVLCSLDKFTATIVKYIISQTVLKLDYWDEIYKVLKIVKTQRPTAADATSIATADATSIASTTDASTPLPELLTTLVGDKFKEVVLNNKTEELLTSLSELMTTEEHKKVRQQIIYSYTKMILIFF
jgi:hypothetical protein